MNDSHINNVAFSYFSIIDNTIYLLNLRTTPGTQQKKGKKKIPYIRTENLKNYTLFRGTYLCSPGNAAGAADRV